MAYSSLLPYICPSVVTNPNLIGPGTLYPWGYTYEEMIFALYRVRKVKLKVEFFAKAVYNEGDPDFEVQDEYSYNLSADLSKNLAIDEAGMACYGNSFQVDFPYNDYTGTVSHKQGSNPTLQNDLYLRSGGGSSSIFRLIYNFSGGRYFDGKYYPLFDRWYGQSAPGSNTGFYVAFPPGWGFPTVNVYFGFPIESYPENNRMKIYRPIFDDQPLSLRNSSAAGFPELDLSIRYLPGDYWPYDPGDTDPYPGKDGSGPVYDSTTGAQLRDPFSIVKRGDGTFYNPLYTPP